MVLGIGIDIIEIERIKKSVDRFGDRFLEKVFTKTEIEYCCSKKNMHQHLAARFAAKEAVAKALSEAWDGGFNWKDIEVYNELSGKPSVKLYGKLEEYVGTDKDLKLTMSHSENYVTAFAIVFLKAGKQQSSGLI